VTVTYATLPSSSSTLLCNERLSTKGTVSYKSHDPCFNVFLMESRVMTFVAHCTKKKQSHLSHVQKKKKKKNLPEGVSAISVVLIGLADDRNRPSLLLEASSSVEASASVEVTTGVVATARVVAAARVVVSAASRVVATSAAVASAARAEAAGVAPVPAAAPRTVSSRGEVGVDGSREARAASGARCTRWGQVVVLQAGSGGIAHGRQRY